MTEEVLASEKDQQEFYAALGRAITGWAALEDILFDIIHSILGATKERASIVYYRTPSLEARLSLVSDLVESFFPKHEAGEQPDPGLKRWREIQSEIRDHAPIRNRLAHHPVGPMVTIYESEDGKEHHVGITIGSYISETERIRKGKWPVPLGTPEINEHTKTVTKLVDTLGSFRRREMPKPPQESGV